MSALSAHHQQSHTHTNQPTSQLASSVSSNAILSINSNPGTKSDSTPIQHDTSFLHNNPNTNPNVSLNMNANSNSLNQSTTSSNPNAQIVNSTSSNNPGSSPANAIVPNSSTTTSNSGNMSGYLLKWTNYLKGYQKRWISINNGLLSYFRHVPKYSLIKLKHSL